MPGPIPAATWDNLFYPPADYRYFRRPLAPASSHSLLRAAWMADAALLAYGRRQAQRLTPAELDGIFDNAGLRASYLGDWFSERPAGTQGYFASSDRFGVLAFRGTEKNDLRDLLTDLEFTMSAESRPDTQLPDTTARIHSGFLRALDDVWPVVLMQIKAFRGLFPAAPLFFTGHSLGGALAALAFIRLGGGCLYTFGCPRVGNAAFCGLFEGRESYRVVDGNDVVTRIPPEETDYAHPRGQPLHVGAPDSGKTGVGGVLDDLIQSPLKYFDGPPEALADHSPIRYCTFLWDEA